MTSQIYNVAVTASSAIWSNPVMLISMVIGMMAIATGLAGRLAILCEDLRNAWLFGWNR